MTHWENSAESAVGLVRGTQDVLPLEFDKNHHLETSLLDSFALAGYRRLRTPILERSELHERKSGTRIVSKLDKTANDSVCLRPELTAGIVRAYAFADEAPPLPWRVSYAGPVFRREEDGEGNLREFHQVGVELIGAARPSADGEVIWLADWALARVGITDAAIRVGHVGLIREILQRSGLPVSLQVSLVEVLADAATNETGAAPGEDRVASALDRHLEHLTRSLPGSDAAEALPAGPSGGGAERLFASLYPNIVGRRSGDEIVGRLRRKWEHGQTLGQILTDVRRRIHDLADLNGPAAPVLERLERDFSADAPDSLTALRGLVGTLRDHGVDLDRVQLDLGFGRGIGFYSQMMFVLLADTAGGPIEVCGGGRYDGLARELGGNRDDRGVGFAFGLERLRDALRLRGHEPVGHVSHSGVLIVPGDASSIASAIALANKLRALDIAAVLDAEARPADAVSAARALGLASAVLVKGHELIRVDVQTSTESPVTLDALLSSRGGPEGRSS